MTETENSASPQPPSSSPQPPSSSPEQPSSSPQPTPEDAAAAFLSGFDATVAEIIALHADDKLFQAARALKVLDDAADRINFPYGDESPLRVKFEDCKDRLTNNPISKIRQESQELQRLMKEFTSADEASGWKQVSRGEIGVWHRHESFSTIHSLRSEAVMDVPLLNLLVLIYEIDLFAGVLPFMQFSRALSAPGRCRKIAHLAFSILWPIAPRDVVVSAWAADGLDEDDCVVVFASSGGDMHEVSPPAPDKGTVRMEFRFGGVYFQPLGPNRTKLVMFQNIDPKIAHVPSTLINFVTRNMISFGIRMIERKAKRLAGTPHEERMRSNTAFYDWLQGRIDSYMGHRRDEEASCLYS